MRAFFKALMKPLLSTRFHLSWNEFHLQMSYVNTSVASIDLDDVLS